jgi:hypothetical protein
MRCFRKLLWLLPKLLKQECTDFRHPPVDALHSAENKLVTNSYFSLTKKIESVKTESFFDTF